MLLSAEFSDERPKEKEEGTLADRELKQHYNNRAGIVTVTFNVLDGWVCVSKISEKEKTTIIT